MFLVDTSVLLHAANRDAPRHDTAYRLLEGWRRGDERWCITWSIAYEFLRVATHRSVFPRPLSLGDALEFVDAILATPRCQVIVASDRHGEILRDLAGECPWATGNVAHDLHTVALMREHGVREIRTADADFLRFRFLDVVDPFRD